MDAVIPCWRGFQTEVAKTYQQRVPKRRGVDNCKTQTERIARNHRAEGWINLRKKNKKRTIMKITNERTIDTIKSNWCNTSPAPLPPPKRCPTQSIGSRGLGSWTMIFVGGGNAKQRARAEMETRWSRKGPQSCQHGAEGVQKQTKGSVKISAAAQHRASKDCHPLGCFWAHFWTQNLPTLR